MTWFDCWSWIRVVAVAFAVVSFPAVADAEVRTMPGQSGQSGLVQSTLGFLQSTNELAELHERGAPDLLDRRLKVGSGDASTSGESEENEGFLGLPELSTGGRLFAETVGGVAAGIAGGAVGAGVGTLTGIVFLVAVVLSTSGGGGGGGGLRAEALVALPFVAQAISSFLGATAFLGGVLGVYAAVPLGIWFGGTVAGGEGKAGWTYLGMVAGLAAAIGIGYGVGAVGTVDGGRLAGLLSAVVLPVAGSYAGYELSHAAASKDKEESAARVRPTLRLRSSVHRPDRITGATAGVRISF